MEWRCDPSWKENNDGYNFSKLCKRVQKKSSPWNADTTDRLYQRQQVGDKPFPGIGGVLFPAITSPFPAAICCSLPVWVLSARLASGGGTMGCLTSASDLPSSGSVGVATLVSDAVPESTVVSSSLAIVSSEGLGCCLEASFVLSRSLRLGTDDVMTWTWMVNNHNREKWATTLLLF